MMRWPSHPPDHVLMLCEERALPPWRQRRVDRHLAGCSGCRRRVDALHAVTAEALLAFMTEDSRAADDALDARVRLEQALNTASDAAPTGPRTVPAPGMLALAAAATVVVVFAAWMTAGGRTGGTPSVHLAVGPLPATHLTPGAVSTLTAAQLCAGVRTSRMVPDRVRRQVLTAYGMDHAPSETYELDALITRELGGTAELANLWPQPYDAPVWNAHVKDALETFLAGAVCSGRMPLHEAQHAIAHDWVGAYQRYFRTATPLAAHAGSTEVDDDLIVEGSQQVLLLTHLLPRGQASP